MSQFLAYHVQIKYAESAIAANPNLKAALGKVVTKAQTALGKAQMQVQTARVAVANKKVAVRSIVAAVRRVVAKARRG